CGFRCGAFPHCFPGSLFCRPHRGFGLRHLFRAGLRFGLAGGGCSLARFRLYPAFIRSLYRPALFGFFALRHDLPLFRNRLRCVGR
ncbi:MAG: hypothetical protein J0H30_14145, partial [Alphaproteobacteria bacterium]|nr:hypothetical protein [Alphaproteobacteria bacterium]